MSIQAVINRRISSALLPVLLVLVLGLSTLSPARSDELQKAQPGSAASQTVIEVNSVDSVQDGGPLIKLGVGDTITMQVYGKPELTTTTYLADDGTILVPLAGAVMVVGLSPSQASQKIADALQLGEFLVNPQVSIVLAQSSSRQVSVLGEVGTPGRYPVESRTTVFDLLALAGGRSAEGASIIYLLRTDGNGNTSRTPINLNSLTDVNAQLPTIKLEGGDTLFVPRAGQFFVYGEIANPNQYRLDPGMTVIQALTRAGGITRRGSSSRIEIKRRKPDGTTATIRPKLSDPVEADDVIRVKESIF